MTTQGGSRHYGTTVDLAKRMRQVAVVQQNTGTADAYGEIVPTWTTLVAAMRCAVETKGGTETTERGQVRALRTVYVTTRWRESLTQAATFRVLLGSRVLNVVAAYDPDESKRVLVLQCTEVEA